MRTSKKRNFVVATSSILTTLLLISFALVSIMKRPEAAIKTSRVIATESSQPDTTFYEFPEPGTLSFIERGEKAEIVNRELYFLALGIYFEARNQPEAGQRKVAEVILNRVADSRWPASIEEVLRQDEEKLHRCQFSFMCDGQPETVNDQQAWQRAMLVAGKALAARSRGASIGCAHSYHADYTTSASALKWFATLESKGAVGNHIFYCDKNA